jgi:hypothetical protein
MNDFWSKRLGTSTPASTPAVRQPVPAPSPAYQVPLPGMTTLPSQGNPKAPSSLSVKHCPECGSGNYTGTPGDSTKMVRCYDCGYNPRFGQQSGAGGLPAGKSAPASPSRQVSTANNYQPGVIVGRIDG